MSDRMERITVRHCSRCDKDLVNGRGGCEGAQHGNQFCAMNNPEPYLAQLDMSKVEERVVAHMLADCTVTGPPCDTFPDCECGPDSVPAPRRRVPGLEGYEDARKYLPVELGGTADSADAVRLPGESQQHANERIAWERYGPRLAEAEAKAERLNTAHGVMARSYAQAQARLAEAERVLRSIASNSCCEPCQEAKRVAQSYFGTADSAPDALGDSAHPLMRGGVIHGSNCAALHTPAFQVVRAACTCGAETVSAQQCPHGYDPKVCSVCR